MRNTILILFSLISLLMSCRSDINLNKRFQKDIEKYTKAYNSKDWEKVTQMIYPKLFGILPKQQMILYFMLSESIGPKTVLEFNRIDSISDIIVSGDEQYCRVFYNGMIPLSITGDLLSKNMDQLKKSYQDKYVSENVQIVEKKHLIMFQVYQSMIAISGKGKNDWKYVEYAGNMKEMLLRIIPEEVHQKLGE